MADKQMWRHGTRGGFTNHGCRCPECSIAERTYQAAYHAKNREKRNAKTTHWRENNPDYERIRYQSESERLRKTANKAARRARGRSLDHGCVTPDALRGIAEYYGGNCVYCGKTFEHIDHFIPLSKFGPHCVENLVTACSRCNLRKGAKMPAEWFVELNGFSRNFDLVKCEVI